MNATTQNRAYRRMQEDRRELRELISTHVPKDGRNEVQPGIRLNRISVTGEPIYGVTEPALCLIAQGSKKLRLGEEQFAYDETHYLISTMGLPVTGRITDASPKRPHLSIQLILDPTMVSNVLVEAGAAESPKKSDAKGIDVSPLDVDLLDAVLRLARMIDRPREYSVLASTVMREIIYRLANGTQGPRLRHLATFGGQAQRISQAVNTLRRQYTQSIRIEDLARDQGMSVSSFHAHFKSATAMSPLQFQKELRLQEARRLMLSEQLDAAEAGYRVGYEDAAYFSRDYKRFFGAPPKRDILRLQESGI